MYKGASRFLQHLAMKNDDKPPQPLQKKKEGQAIPTNIKRLAGKTGVIKGCIQEEVKGGYTIIIQNFRAFCPHSEMYPKLSALDVAKKESLHFQVIKIDVGKSSVILSRKRAAAQEGWRKAVDAFQKRILISGTVKDIKRYGAFIDLGGIDGLLHKSEISNQFIDDVSKVLSKGQQIRAFVIGLDPDQHRVSLSLRQLPSSAPTSHLKSYTR